MDVIGNGTNETLPGTKGNDYIFGDAGNDAILASQGTDVIDGGTGTDRLTIIAGDAIRFDTWSGPRTYVITNDSATDTSGLLNSSLSSIERLTINTIGTGDYDDAIDVSGFFTTAPLPVLIQTGAGNDAVTGSSAGDTIQVGLGSNWVDAGAGTDTVRFQFSNDSGETLVVAGSGGAIQTTIGDVHNTILSAEYIEVFAASNSAGATIDASAVTGFSGQIGYALANGTNVVTGHEGIDFFSNNAGWTESLDTMTGNGGADIYDYTFSVAAMDGDVITDFDSDDLIDLQFNTPARNGGSLANQFIGNDAFTGIVGQYRFDVDVDQGLTFLEVDTNGDGNADEILTIANGNFALAETFAGSNQLKLAGVSGGSGDDFLVGSREGNDQIFGQDGNDVIGATGGLDHIDGGDGFDQLRFLTGDSSRFILPSDSRTITVTDDWVGASDGTINTYHSGVELISIRTTGTGDHGDTIDASALTNADLALRLGAGNDTVMGGAGNDSLSLGLGLNTADGGDGSDTVFLNFDNSGGATALLTSSGGTVYASVGGTVVATVSNAEVIHIEGQNGTGVTTVIDASGFAPVDGITLVLRDSNGDDIIIGSSGSDFLSNVSTHADGSDTFTGNGGADVFDWTFASDNIHGDVITDLDADDTLDFRFNDGTAVGGSPLLCNQFIGNDAFSGIAGQYRFDVDLDQGFTYLQVDSDGDGLADQVMTITNGAFALSETAVGSNILHIVGLSGGSGDDFLVGTKADENIFGQDGNDSVAATQGLDRVDGGDGFDQLRFILGNANRFDAAIGPRTITIDQTTVTDGSGLINTTFSWFESVFVSTVNTGSFGDTIDGTNAAQSLTIRAGNGDDTIFGGHNDDDIATGLGSNVVDAGEGNDFVNGQYDNSTGATAYVSLVAGSVVTTLNGIAVNTISNAEGVGVFGFDANTGSVIDASGLTGYSGTLYFGDTNASNVAMGHNGADFFANVMTGVTGTDVYTGNGGADIYDYTFAAGAMNGDIITDFDADDVIDLQFNNLVQNGGGVLADQFIGNNSFSGVAGQYRFFAQEGQTFVQIDTNGDGAADQTLTIANGQFALGETSPASNVLHIIGVSGTVGSDTLVTTLGNDSVYGQAGNDILYGSQGSDYVDGGAGGGDRLHMNTGDASLFTAASGARTYVIGANSITDSSGTLNTAFASVERINLSTVGNGDFDDTIDASGFVSGHALALDVRLGNGDNTVTASSGNDRVFTGFGSNIVDGANGYDSGFINIDAANAITVKIQNVDGVLVTDANGAINHFTNFEEVWVQGVGGGSVTLDASDYTDIQGMLLVLIGHNGSDIMIGSAGSDYFGNITGQVLGNDVYTGNGGSDIYDYTYAADSMNGDTIMDFDIDDVIDMRFNTLLPGQSPIRADHFIGDAEFSGSAGEYRYQVNGTTTIVQVDSNGDGVADQTLTIANGGFALAETFTGSNILTLAAVINPLEGVVADGYLADAKVFVDVDGDGAWDAGEAWTTTDAAGNFTLNVNQAGTIVAIGGTNLDTGLVNKMDLKAPFNASVVNPLTTLIAAVMASNAISAAAAETVVKDALDLDSSLDLLSTDLLAGGSSAATLEAQKAAAMIVNLVTTAETLPGLTESLTLEALAAAISSGPVDLTSSASIDAILEDALNAPVSNVISAQLATEAAAIDAATTLGGVGSAQLAAALTGDDLANELVGNEAANVITGNGGNDHLVGNGGDDTLNGGLGADTMEGGLGNDLYIIDQGGDQVIELSEAGIDTVRSSVAYTLGANVENLELTGSSAINGTGNGAANLVTGNSAANTLSGLAGNDVLVGGGGSDRLFGGSGVDILRGGDGHDFLNGGADNDRFVMDLGGPIMTKSGPLSLDTVLDFQAGEKIDLSFLNDGDANSLLAGNQDFAWKGTNVSKDAGSVWYKTYDSVQGAEKALGYDIDGVNGTSPYGGPVTIVYGNHDGGSADFAVALIGVGALQAHDLIMG